MIKQLIHFTIVFLFSFQLYACPTLAELAKRSSFAHTSPTHYGHLIEQNDLALIHEQLSRHGSVNLRIPFEEISQEEKISTLIELHNANIHFDERRIPDTSPRRGYYEVTILNLNQLLRINRILVAAQYNYSQRVSIVGLNEQALPQGLTPNIIQVAQLASEVHPVHLEFSLEESVNIELLRNGVNFDKIRNFHAALEDTSLSHNFTPYYDIVPMRARLQITLYQPEQINTLVNLLSRHGANTISQGIVISRNPLGIYSSLLDDELKEAIRNVTHQSPIQAVFRLSRRNEDDIRQMQYVLNQSQIMHVIHFTGEENAAAGYLRVVINSPNQLEELNIALVRGTSSLEYRYQIIRHDTSIVSNSFCPFITTDMIEILNNNRSIQVAFNIIGRSQRDTEILTRRLESSALNFEINYRENQTGVLTIDLYNIDQLRILNNAILDLSHHFANEFGRVL